jgi:hypothetical protein
MSYRQLIARELEVAFSKNAQPVWFLGIGAGFGVLLHLWYRYRTKGWTQSYGGWNYEKNKPRGLADKAPK